MMAIFVAGCKRTLAVHASREFVIYLIAASAGFTLGLNLGLLGAVLGAQLEILRNVEVGEARGKSREYMVERWHARGNDAHAHHKPNAMISGLRSLARLNLLLAYSAVDVAPWWLSAIFGNPSLSDMQV